MCAMQRKVKNSNKICHLKIFKAKKEQYTSNNIKGKSTEKTSNAFEFQTV